MLQQAPVQAPVVQTESRQAPVQMPVPAPVQAPVLPLIKAGEQGTRADEPNPSILLSRNLPTLAQPIIQAVSRRFTLPLGGSWALEGVYVRTMPTEANTQEVFVHWVDNRTSSDVWFSTPYDVSGAWAAQEALERAQDALESTPMPVSIAAPVPAPAPIPMTQAVRQVVDPMSQTVQRTLAMTSQAAPTVATISTEGRSVRAL
jgi:hypothetical protein